MNLIFDFKIYQSGQALINIDEQDDRATEQIRDVNSENRESKSGKCC